MECYNRSSRSRSELRTNSFQSNTLTSLTFLLKKDTTANVNTDGTYHGRINCARCGATSFEHTKPNRPIVIATNKMHMNDKNI